MIINYEYDDKPGLPSWLRRWRICLQCKRPGFDPWVVKIPWRRHGYTLQYSCRENSRDRGAWQATVYRVAKSWTRLRDWHFHFHIYWGRLWYVNPFNLHNHLMKWALRWSIVRQQRQGDDLHLVQGHMIGKSRAVFDPGILTLETHTLKFSVNVRLEGSWDSLIRTWTESWMWPVLLRWRNDWSLQPGPQQ